MPAETSAPKTRKSGPTAAANLARRAQAQQRRKQVVEMRLAGATNGEVAETLGISEGRASSLYRAAVESIPYESVKAYRTKQLRQLDRLLTVWWPRAVGQPERVVRVDGVETRIPAVPPSEKAFDRVVKLLERHARLTGIDRPIQISGPDGGAISLDVDGILAAARAAREKHPRPADQDEGPEDDDGDP